ncbi:Sister chromatid cohesion protein pds5 [Lithohypha guttulata]|uniref:Sister chromatid cohesion protein pds5 n=1 Tax=Lithohypha guttulata TaxID=1690604 RepID=A0AAN7T7N7_9EURO|nr:Sister chromatid cohesion protein pds5 [Lithohypha guttulata]
MPTRSRQSNARATAQPEAEEAAYNITGLDFNEPLTWRAGKAIPVADLFTRLQKLSNELRNVDDQAIDVKEIAGLAQDLVHPNLLGHKDKGVRAWTVACVVDILNICAPDAPYRPNQLRDIFTVIINTILPALADPSNAYNAQHQYILDQLVDAQSIVLITDIQDADTLITQLFTNAFDVVSGSGKSNSSVELAQSVVFQITMMLNTVVDEANLPQEVIDIIIAQFLRVDPRSHEQPAATKRKTADAKDKTQSTLLLKNYPPAYNLAKSVCTACSEKMAAAISQYFNVIITNAGGDLTDDVEEKAKSHRRHVSPDSDNEGQDQDSLNDLKKAHRLVRELWRACPDVLVNVVPQIELELAADAKAVRRLAVETLGDMIAGIGLAGLPDLPTLDPAAFPQPTIETADITILSNNPLLQPSAPKPFIHVHPATYQAFLGRRIDRDVSVRASFAKAVGRVLLTRAAGSALRDEELSALIAAQAKMLKDVDERVRLSALQSLENFPYHTVVDMLGSDGGLSEPSSLLSTIAERVTDKKPHVREKAMYLLGCMWGSAARDVGNVNDRVCSILGQIPTRLLSSMYVKDNHIGALLSKALYEYLLPLSYPPIKGNITISETQGDGDVAQESVDPDSLRVRRILTLIRDLDERAKPVFFGLQKRQADLSKAITTFLRACEEYNAGVADDESDEKRLKEQLTRFIDSLSRQLPDPAKAVNDLWKFARAHDRRAYQLIRFAMGAEHEYKTMTKAIKELNKRLRDNGMGNVLETLMPILYQCALISYNRSHIPAIMDYARSPDNGFAEAAQEVLREISEKVPEVMKTHIQVLCGELEDMAPSQKNTEPASAVDSLKACSAFARRFPEDLPKERRFYTAMLAFVQFSQSPKAAKHAATITLLASDKKEMYAKDVLTKAIKACSSGTNNRLTHLAAISQVCLIAPAAASAQEDQILKIVNETLQTTESKSIEWDQTAWSDEIDDETAAKQFALRIHVNRCRGERGRDNKEKFEELASTAVKTLLDVIEHDGIVGGSEAPSTQRNHLRLTAAKYILKLCRHKQRCEELITPEMFHTIAWILLSPPHGVRSGLVHQLKKYLSQNRLNARWLTLLFLLPFEPDDELRVSTIAWLKSRADFFARQQKQARMNSDKKPAQNIIELLLARFISLLAHHPDFPAKGDDDYEGQMLDFAKYIIFYLQCVATDDNLSLIFHVAQRIKQAADATSNSEEMDERLYILSDLAQATIRNYADQMPGSAKGTNLLQTWPGRTHLPNLLFKAINGHAKAQDIAAKNYLPEDVAAGLTHLVKRMIRNTKQSTSSRHKTPASDRKRKLSMSIDADDDNDNEPGSTRKSAKKNKRDRAASSLPIRKTPSKSAKKRKSEQAALSVEQPSRKSVRMSSSKKVNYEESDDDDEEEGDAEDVIPYKPAPMEKYKHKTTKARDETPVIEEEDEEDDDAGDDQEEEAASPTQQRKSATKKVGLSDDESGVQSGEAQDDEVAAEEHEEEVIESEDAADVEMMNGADKEHGDDVPTNDEQDAMDEDEEEEEEGEEEGEDAEATPSPPAPKRNGKATRAKATPQTASASDKTSKAKEKVSSTKKPVSTTKAKPSSKKDVARDNSATTSPAAVTESTRRSSRRHKV